MPYVSPQRICKEIFFFAVFVIGLQGFTAAASYPPFTDRLYESAHPLVKPFEAGGRMMARDYRP